MKLKLRSVADIALIYASVGIVGVGVYYMMTDFATFIASTSLVLLFCSAIYVTMALFEWRHSKHTKRSKRKSK